MIKRITNKFSQFIDFKMGLAGALVMGLVVYRINYNASVHADNAFVAAGKQAVYTFFLGGSFMKLCEYIATRIKSKLWAIVLSAAVPSLITLFLTYNIHMLKGTAKPFESTLPTLTIIPVTLVWGIRKRRQYGELALQEENSSLK